MESDTPGRRDAIDHMHARWSVVRPDLDLEPMGVIGRLLRLVPVLMARCETFLAPHDLSRAEFDIVSALRRSDRPVSPGELSRQLLFTGPATTKRLHRLEDADWIVRRANPDDARGFLLELTPDGSQRFDEVLPQYVAFEASLISALDTPERACLSGHLRAMLVALDA